MRYCLEIFWRLSWNKFTFNSNSSKFLVCVSVYQLAYFLTEIRLIWGYIQFWMRYLSEFFWTHSKDISQLFPNYSKFLVCLSAYQLAYFLTKIRLIQGYLQFCRRYFSKIVWRLSLDVCILDPNNSEILLSLSVCQLAYSLTEIRLIQVYIVFWRRYLSGIFGGLS